MKQKIINATQEVRAHYSRQPLLTRVLVFALPAVLLVAIGIFSPAFTGNKDLANAANDQPEKAAVAEGENPLIAIVGVDNSLTTSTLLSNSWPGEVLSYGNVPIQPAREGTLIEWRVKIGERVEAGQVLARLSAPPAMPELVKMLAEQAEGLARARAEVSTTERFTEENNKQLETLLRSVETTANVAQNILIGTNDKTGTAKVAIKSARDAVTAMQQNIRSMLQQTLIKHIGVVGTVGPSFTSGSLNPYYGATNSQNQNDYQTEVVKLIWDLKNNNVDTLPIDDAKSYFILFNRLINTTLGADESTRVMARDDQEKFLNMLASYQDAEADVAMKETEYSLMSSDRIKEFEEQKKEIEEKISENNKMLAMARAEVAAAEVSYSTVNRSITGGLTITAPLAGTVSTILKKVGDFVEPGMPVASIDSKKGSEKFVRLRVPSNTKLPLAGTTVSVIRPGFPQDVQKATLTGVGTSLDRDGSFMADATLVGGADWPVGASVRIIVPDDVSTPIIQLSSVRWDEGGVPYVWAVSVGGRLFAKKIVIGRTLGNSIEVYQGLANGDRYIKDPTPDMHEDMLLDEIKIEDDRNSPATSDGKEPMGGMPM